MSQAEFQARLQRIGAASSSPQPAVNGVSPEGPPRKQKIRHGMLATGALFLTLGYNVLRYAVSNYSLLQDKGDTGSIIGIGSAIAGSILLLAGGWLAIRATARSRSVSSPASEAHHAYRPPQRGRKSSPLARLICTLLGTALGAAACFSMFIAGTASYVGTQNGESLAIGSFTIAAALAFIAIILGCAGLVLRGRGLGRVPLYFVCGAVLTYVYVRTSGINLLEWRDLMNAVQ